MLSAIVRIVYYAECRIVYHAQCRLAQCRGAFVSSYPSKILPLLLL
jgi:hypothetical protein